MIKIKFSIQWKCMSKNGGEKQTNIIMPKLDIINGIMIIAEGKPLCVLRGFSLPSLKIFKVFPLIFYFFKKIIHI